MPADAQSGGFGLYIHWPFCQAKCPYCDFNSHVTERIDHGRWALAYLAEIDRAAAETPGRILQSVYFGGGTPSLMAPDTVAAILDRVQTRWPMVNDPEITLEANPTSVEAGRFRAYREAGVTRVSVGVQALDDAALRLLGRLHSVEEARRALDVARTHFDRVSFDLIYARQHQTPDDWRAELAAAMELAPDHLSLYQLTIEDGTAFGARHAAGRLPGLPDEERARRLWDITQEMTAEAGLPAYEVSNHARPGSESRHNLIYWRGGDYLGIGPGAHGRLTLGGRRWATETHRAPAAWLNAVETASHGELPRTEVPRPEQAQEYAMMALRLSEGMSLSRYAALGGPEIAGNTLIELEGLGLVMRNGDTLAVTGTGRPVLNAVLARLIA